MAILFVAAVRRKRAVRSWTPALATVVKSEVVWGTVSRGGGASRRSLALFAYQYKVGGQVYRGNRIAFYRRCTGTCAQELVARHPVGSRVQIYYDPTQPAEAVVDRSFRVLWVLPIMAFVFGVLSVVFFKLPSMLGR